MIYITNDKRLMRMAFNSTQELKRYHLTDMQRRIISAISDHDYPTASSRELCEKFGCSVQSISAQLTKLYLKGYLEQETRHDPTGGIIYRYSVVEFLGKNKRTPSMQSRRLIVSK